MKPPFSYVPLLPVFVALVAGVLLALLPFGIYAGCIILVVTIVLLLLRQTVLSTLLMTMALGWAVMFISLPRYVDEIVKSSDSRQFQLIATVNSVAETQSGRRLNITVDKIASDTANALESIRRFDMILYVGSLFPEITPGDIISCKSLFFDRNRPSDLPDIEPLFREITRPTAFSDEADVMVVGQSRAVRFKLLRVRDWLVDRLYIGSLSPSTSDLLAAVLLGDSGMIDASRRESFSSSGLAHLLALSGAHVAVIVMILSVVILPLRLMRRGATSYVVLIVLLWIYALMTGLSVSVVRAVIMATFVAGAYILNSRQSSLNSLFAAAILILVFNPSALFEVSFQLSFLAAGSILLLLNGFMSFAGRNHFIIVILKYVGLPVAAMAGTWALSVYYFGTFPLLFLVSSIPASLIMTVMLMLGSAYLFLMVLGVNFTLLAWLLNLLDRLLTWIIDITTVPSWSVVDNIYLPPVAVFLFILVPVALAGFFWRRRLVWAIATIALILSGVVVTRFSTIPTGSELYVTSEKNHTNIIARHDNQIRLLTTANQNQLPSLVKECSRKYKKYMSRRRCSQLVGSSINTSPSILRWNDVTIAIVTDNLPSAVTATNVDYILVCRGFRGDILSLVEELSPNATVILSNDLNRRRHDRYLQELTSASVPVHSIRQDGSFTLTTQMNI